MSAERTDQTTIPGWGWPLVAAVVIHVAVAFAPVDFTNDAHAERTTDVDMVAPPPMEAPEPTEEPEVEPESEPEEPEPEPAPEPEPEPEPEPPVEADEPSHEPEESEVAVADEVEPPEEEEPDVEETIDDEPDEVTEEAEVDPLPMSTDFLEQRPDPAENPTPEPEPEPVDWQGYGRSVMQSVQHEKNYPRMAQRRNMQGTATVEITIDRHGELAASPNVVESTDYGILDDEVIRMVESAAPFDGFPDHSDDDEREFVIPIQFRLEG